MNPFRALIVFLAVLFTCTAALAQSEPTVLLTLKAPGQVVKLTQNDCTLPGAPDGVYAALFETEGQKYEGCWGMTPTGVLLVTPKGMPGARDDLKPEPPSPAKPSRGPNDPGRLVQT